MSKKTSSNKVKTAKELKEEEEKFLILSKADEVKGEQLTIDIDGELSTRQEIEEFIIGDPHSPEKMYDAYYRGIEKLLKRQLPQGKEFEPARKLIREEKNTFLTRGHRIKDDGTRGADSRMGHVEDAEKIVEILVDWVLSGSNMVDLYNKLRDLNVSLGYGTAKA